MKGFIDEVPAEYEAAMLDGYSRFEAFWRVTMPLPIPGIAATAVFALIFSWNEFVFSIFLITDPDTRTAPAAIAGLIGGTTIDWGLVAASAMVFAIPVLVFAFLVRKHLVAGVTPGRCAADGRGPRQELHKAFPDGTVAVEELDLEIGDGELFVMLGPSGAARRRRCAASPAGAGDLGQIVIGDEVGGCARPSATSRWCSSSTRSIRTERARQHGVPAARGQAAGVRDRRAGAEAARMLQLEPFLTRRRASCPAASSSAALGRAMVRHPRRS